jgi:hypothetical protein
MLRWAGGVVARRAAAGGGPGAAGGPGGAGSAAGRPAAAGPDHPGLGPDGPKARPADDPNDQFRAADGHQAADRLGLLLVRVNAKHDQEHGCLPSAHRTGSRGRQSDFRTARSCLCSVRPRPGAGGWHAHGEPALRRQDVSEPSRRHPGHATEPSSMPSTVNKSDVSPRRAGHQARRKAGGAGGTSCPAVKGECPVPRRRAGSPGVLSRP